MRRSRTSSDWRAIRGRRSLQMLCAPGWNSRAAATSPPPIAVTDMWSACWQISLRVARKLNFEEPGVKPGRATWFYFWEAEGFSKEDSKRAVVVYKAERGQANLQFRGTRVAALAAAPQGLVEPALRILGA